MTLDNEISKDNELLKILTFIKYKFVSILYFYNIYISFLTCIKKSVEYDQFFYWQKIISNYL